MGPTLHPHLPYNWGSRLLCQIYTHLNSDLIIKSCRLLSAGESEIYEKSYA